MVVIKYTRQQLNKKEKDLLQIYSRLNAQFRQRRLGHPRQTITRRITTKRNQVNIRQKMSIQHPPLPTINKSRSRQRIHMRNSSEENIKRKDN